MVTTYLKEKIIGATGSVSGAASVLGSWQICHSVCLAIVAMLSVIGITVVGMPLAFLTTIAVPMWSIAAGLLLVTLILYFTKKCISSRMILFNSGLIVAGVPFQAVKSLSPLFWAVGGALAATGVGLYVKDKLDKKKCQRCHHGKE